MQVLSGGTFFTCDPAHPTSHALAIDEGRIVALGDAATALAGERVDLRGQWITPGLVDAHLHLSLMARAEREIDVSAATSEAQVLALLQAGATVDGWRIGRGFDQTRWPNGAMPNAEALDRTFTNEPVIVRRIDEHCVWLNRVARERLGVSAHLLLEQDMDRALEKVPRPRVSLEHTAQRLRALGVTSVHDLAAREDELPAFASLPLRVRAYLYSEDDADYLRWCRDGLPAHGVKVFLDGALGSRGARLLAPYDDAPHHHGLRYMPEDRARHIVQAVRHARLPLALHAIGDAAVREAIDWLERFPSPAECRIEHAQLVAPSDFQRLARLGAKVCVQFVHWRDDLRWTEARLGQRAEHAHPWRQFLDHGVTLLAGSDAPIADPSPALGLKIASSRGLTRQQALAAYLGAATLAPGQPADLTVWSNDPLCAETPIVACSWWQGRP